MKVKKSFQMVLNALRDAKGPMTRRMVEQKIGLGNLPENGRVPQETLTYRSLEADGCIKEVVVETDMGEETCYEITAKGRKLLDSEDPAKQPLLSLAAGFMVV